MEKSEGCLSRLSRALAVLLVVVFVVTAPIALVARAASQVLFSPEVMADLLGSRLQESEVDRRLLGKALLTETLATPAEGGEETGTSLLSGVEPRDLDRISKMVLPAGWGREQLVANLSGLYAWLDDDRLIPRITLDLRPVKAQLLGGAEELAEVVLEAWPSCTPEQLARMGLAVLQGESLEACEPPEPIRSVLAAMLAEGVREAGNALPPSLDVGPQLVSADVGVERIDLFKEQVRMLRFLTRWGWLVPAAFLGLIVALVVRSFESLCRWWGIPLTAGGLVGLVSLLPLSGLGRAFGRSLASDLQGEPLLAEFAGSLLNAIVRSISARAAIGALILTAAGTGLLLVRRMTTRGAKAGRPGGAPERDAQGGTILGSDEGGLPAGQGDDRPTGAFG